jgi:hypothetical protein
MVKLGAISSQHIGIAGTGFSARPLHASVICTINRTFSVFAASEVCG